MLGTWQWNELTLAVPGTQVSANAVSGNGDNAAPLGVAEGNFDDFVSMRMEADLQGVTGGNLDVYVQSFWLGHWYDLAHFPTIAAGTPLAHYAFIAGPGYVQTAQQFGIDLTPALAANTILGGPWGEKLRLLMVTGGGTASFVSVAVRLIAQRPTMTRVGL